MRGLFVTPQFRKDLRSIPREVQEQADALNDLLLNNPINPTLNAKKLVNIHPPAWRIRIGTYHLVYTFNRDQVILLRFRHRKDIYKNL